MAEGAERGEEFLAGAPNRGENTERRPKPMERQQRTPGQAGGPTPERILQIAWGFAPTYALASALELRLFAHVAGGKTTQAALEAATGASRRGLGMLLNAMVGLGFLTRAGSGEAARYGLAPDAKAFLVEGQPGYHGGIVCLAARRGGAGRGGGGVGFGFRAGDTRGGDLGGGAFGGATLGHFCHPGGAEHSRGFRAKVPRALKRGAPIVIADMLRDEDRSGPPFPL